MVPSSTRQDTRARRAFFWIAVAALLMAAALTGAWYYMASRLDLAVRSAIETAGGQGVAIACGGQEVFGYPFRLGLHCDSLAVDAPEKNFRAGAGELRTAAQIYRPTQVVAELDGPLSIAAEGAPPFDMRWNLAQASAHFWTEGLDRFALVLEAPILGMADAGGAIQPLVRSDRFEAHARRRGDALDVAVTDRGIKPLAPALSALPAFDLAGDITVEGAADWLSGRRNGTTLGQALAGKSGTIRALSIAIAGAQDTGSAAVSGPFEVAEDGRISGEFDLVVAGAEKIAGLVSTLAPQYAGVAGSVASGIGFAGKTENGRTTIKISVREGQASLGFISLGEIPPLR